jgi:MGT family glycosyltransferase
LSVVFAIRPEVVRVADLVNLLYGEAPEEKLRSGLVSLSRYLEVSQRIGERHATCTPGIIEYLGNPHPLTIIFTSREFQIRGDDFGREFQFVGPSIPSNRDADHDFPFERLGPEPLVYISLGTTFNHAPDFYRACFGALADTPFQVVLSGGGGDFRGVGEPPRNFIMREYVPQLDMLKRASVFVTHGGMNSANEGLYHGIPLVVVPQRGDQHLVARRVAELGAGIALGPGDVTSCSLRNAVLRVALEPDFRKNARAIGRTLRKSGGCERAAAEILRFASGRIRVSVPEEAVATDRLGTLYVQEIEKTRLNG